MIVVLPKNGKIMKNIEKMGNLTEYISSPLGPESITSTSNFPPVTT